MATETDEKTRKKKKKKKGKKSKRTKKRRNTKLFGERAVDAEFITRKQLDECLKLQKKYQKKGKKVPKLGEILAHKKYLSKEQVVTLLKDPEEDTPTEAPTEAPTEEPTEVATEVAAEPTRDSSRRKRRKREKPELLPGQIYAEFLVEEKMFTDSLGDTYLARQDKKERPVNLVVVDPERATGEFKKTLLDQMKVVAKMEHRNLQKVYMFGKSKGCYYVALEYIRGDRLDEKLRSRKPLEYTHAMDLFWNMIDGLKYLHSGGVLHLNIQPKHIMLGAAEAKLTHVGIPDDPQISFENLPMGKPFYYAPEQLDGGTVDSRADVFSLGAVMYHVMTGTPAFRGKTPEEVVEKIHAGDVPSIRKYNQRVPAEASDLIDKMLSPNPDDRYENIGRVRKFVNKLPQEMKTQVAMDYKKVLGEQALQAPAGSSSSARMQSPTSSSQQLKSPAAGSSTRKHATGSQSKRVKDMDYSELVAQMTTDAAIVDAAEKKGSTQKSSLATLAGTMGRSHRRVEAQVDTSLPGWLKGSVLAFLIIGLLGAGGFYWWGVMKQDKLNEKMREDQMGKGLGGETKDQKREDKPAAPTKSAEELQDEACQQLYDKAIKQIEDMARGFKRGDLEKAIAYLEQCIKRGKPSWRYLGDAYNLMGRCRLYWAYTDHTDEIQPSVKKDYSGTAVRNLNEAVRLYKLKNADTNFRLPIKHWMPEHQEATTYVFEWKSFRAPLQIKHPDAKEAAAHAEHIARAAKRLY